MRGFKKFYKKRKMMIWIGVIIIAIAAALLWSDYAFSMFGGFTRKPL